MVATNEGNGNSPEARAQRPRPLIDLGGGAFDAWVDPGANELGLGVIDIEKVTARDVRVRVIPCTEASIKRVGGLLTAAIGAKAAVEALAVLGVHGSRSEAWGTDVEVECPECSAVWELTVEEDTEPGTLTITHVAYGCDHRAVLGEVEETAIESARERASNHVQALNDEASAKGV